MIPKNLSLEHIMVIKLPGTSLCLKISGWCTVCPGALPEEGMSLRILIR